MWPYVFPLCGLLAEVDDQWLKYLLTYLLHSKALRKPQPIAAVPAASAGAGNGTGTTASKSDHKGAEQGPVTRGLASKIKFPPAVLHRNRRAYEQLSLVEVALDAALKAKGAGAGSGRKRGVDMGSAGDVLIWGRDMGWIG
jgi:hypothetical protein